MRGAWRGLVIRVAWRGLFIRGVWRGLVMRELLTVTVAAQWDKQILGVN